MLPNSNPTLINSATGQDALQIYYRTLTRHNTAPTVFYATHPALGNLEFLVAFNSVDGLAEQSPDEAPLEDRARRFLAGHATLFRLRPEVFAENLVLKYTLHSPAGTHLIFEARSQGMTVEDTGFSVHFDHQRRLVMISAAYDPARVFDGRAVESVAIPNKAIQQAYAEHQPLGGLSLERSLWPDPDNPEGYRALWRFKYQDRQHTTHYYFSDQEKIIDHFTVNSGLMPAGWGIGQVYDRFWTERGSRPVLQRLVVLRDLTSDRELKGRYVEVRDEVSPTDPGWMDVDAHSLFELGQLTPAEQQMLLPPRKFIFKEDKSWADRVMAYFHTDLVQRYFRDLGLSELERCAQLNPIIVALDRLIPNSENATKFSINDQQIHLKQLGERAEFTQAREARVIYHEFTHAVTDALARLHRGNLGNPAHRRRYQMLQAAAMDEGLADYFACSLAARTGAVKPRFGLLSVQRKKLKWKIERDLLAPRLPSEPASSGVAAKPLDLILDPAMASKATPTDLYPWAERWGWFLWQLRSDEEIGSEVADVLAANSIFFLTRWSTIIVGVLAIMLVDDLLFGGLHLEAIREIAAKGGVNLDQFKV